MPIYLNVPFNYLSNINSKFVMRFDYHASFSCQTLATSYSMAFAELKWRFFIAFFIALGSVW